MKTLRASALAAALGASFPGTDGMGYGPVRRYEKPKRLSDPKKVAKRKSQRRARKINRAKK